MPKKKTPRNAFYFFMLDYKARCERNGERFPNGLRDVQLEAGPEWNVLPANEKKKYEDMAKEEKARLKGDSSNKLTCWHTPYKVVDDEKDEEERFKNEMNSYIENTVSSLASKKLLAEHKFYLVHVNYFCITEGECYHPAELAVSEFSLAEGIIDVYSTIISPGNIPLGYRHNAMQNAENSHKIPIDDNGGEKNFYNILIAVKNILQRGRASNGGMYPPMYTMPDNVSLNTSISAVRSVMKNLLSSDTEDYDENMFKIYSLEKLFLELRQACKKLSESEEDDAEAAIPAMSIARTELEKDVFNFIPNIACPFHYDEEAVEYCSKSYVQRWVYLICDHCCGPLDITIVQGKHIPLNADVNFQKKKLEEKKETEVCSKPITWVDHSKVSASASTWVPREQAPLPRPQRQSNTAQLLSKSNEFGYSSEDFPSIPLGRGRGRGTPRGNGRGNSPLSFAAATRK
uniref:HMG box domain-containing protein n=1 Tax=Homalodisca liturata TaxID=320908 RepID=A0A1B6J7Z9_9HEMI